MQNNNNEHNTTTHNTQHHNTTQHNTTQHNTTQHNTTQHKTKQHNTRLLYTYDAANEQRGVDLSCDWPTKNKISLTTSSSL